MSKKVKKVASIATLGASDLAIKPIESAIGAVTGAITPQQAMTGSTVADTTTPTSVDPAVQEARDAQRRRQLQAAGLSSTIATGAGGLSGAANTAVKTLLGS